MVARWVRSEDCRHAFLLVRGAMYLLEFPADAVEDDEHPARGCTEAGKTTAAPSSASSAPQPPAPVPKVPFPAQPPRNRGWCLKVVPHSLQSVSVPMSQGEVGVACGGGKGGGGRGGGRRAAMAGGRGGLIFHTRSGCCAWMECPDARSRDELVQVVAAWHSAEIKGRSLKVCYLPQAEAMDKVRGPNGAGIRSLLHERKSCMW